MPEDNGDYNNPCSAAFSPDTTPAKLPGDYSIGSRLWPGLSKLIEEMGEVQQIAGKLIATGGAATHWDGSDLTARLADELADLGAAITFFSQLNGLDSARYYIRVNEKIRTFHKWHEEQQ